MSLELKEDHWYSLYYKPKQFYYLFVVKDGCICGGWGDVYKGLTAPFKIELCKVEEASKLFDLDVGYVLWSEIPSKEIIDHTKGIFISQIGGGLMLTPEKQTTVTIKPFTAKPKVYLN